MIITADIANSIWDSLFYAGADEHGREAFVHTAVGQEEVPEYRFQGKLGFGGKIRIRKDRWYVDYYSEHQTTDRDAIADTVNQILAVVKERWENIEATGSAVIGGSVTIREQIPGSLLLADIKIDLTSLRQANPNLSLKDFARWSNQILNEVQTAWRQLKPGDAFVHTDAITVQFLEEESTDG